MRKRGDEGEAAARRVLERAGFCIVANNFSVRGGEIDIVARAPDGCVVFVEVKLRVREPVDHRSVITNTKLRRMQLAARHFLMEHGPIRRFRYDLILLVPVVGKGRAEVFWYKDVTAK